MQAREIWAWGVGGCRLYKPTGLRFLARCLTHMTLTGHTLMSLGVIDRAGRRPAAAWRLRAGHQPGTADTRADRQHRQDLGFGRAQRADATFGPVTDGQVRDHVRERPAEGRIPWEGRVHGGGERPERPGRLGSQPEDILVEPVRAGEPAAEGGHGPHRPAAIWIPPGVICPGGTNGYSTVTWAGIPRPAERHMPQVVRLAIEVA